MPQNVQEVSNISLETIIRSVTPPALKTYLRSISRAESSQSNIQIKKEEPNPSNTENSEWIILPKKNTIHTECFESCNELYLPSSEDRSRKDNCLVSPIFLKKKSKSRYYPQKEEGKNICNDTQGSISDNIMHNGKSLELSALNRECMVVLKKLPISDDQDNLANQCDELRENTILESSSKTKSEKRVVTPVCTSSKGYSSKSARKRLDLTPSTATKRNVGHGFLTPVIPEKNEKFLNKHNSGNIEQTRIKLQASTVPESLPCRNDEFNNIKTFVLRKILDGTGGCMYISGVPGTGKTATVHAVVKSLQRDSLKNVAPSFDNNMCYIHRWRGRSLNERVFFRRVSEYFHCQWRLVFHTSLEKTFIQGSTVLSNDEYQPCGNKNTFVEVNGLRLTEPRQSYVRIWQTLSGEKVNMEQALKYLEKKFAGRPQRTVVILLDELDYLCNKRQDVIYNLLEWTMRKNSKLVILTIANTMDLPERTLKGKITSRMGLTRLVFQPYSYQQLQEIVTNRLGSSHSFHPDAIQLVARKVAAISGDARRALDICRRATEMLDDNHEQTISVFDIDKVISNIFMGVRVQAIKNSSPMCQLVLRAIRDEVFRTGVEETIFNSLFNHLITICSLEGISLPNLGEVSKLINILADSGLILAERDRTDLKRKLTLNVSPDDIHYALNC